MSYLSQFETERMSVVHWNAVLRDPVAKAELKKTLVDTLTPAVLIHLPESLQLIDPKPEI